MTAPSSFQHLPPDAAPGDMPPVTPPAAWSAPAPHQLPSPRPGVSPEPVHLPPPAWPAPPFPYPPGTPSPAVRQYPPLLPVEGRRPPLWLFVVLLALPLGLSIRASLIHGPVGDVTPTLARSLSWWELGFASGVLVIVVVGRWGRAVGWTPRRGVTRAVPLIALALVVASALTITVSGSYLGWGGATYAVLLVNCLAVGVFEETMFRGLLWASLPQGWSASRVLLVTSLVFGAVHVTNGFTTGLWGVAVLQACVVSVMGLGLGALRLRTGWLGVGVVTHMFIDAGITAYGMALTHARVLDPSQHRYPVLVLLCALALLSLYATLGVAGIVVLVRTFRSERQDRRLGQTYREPAPDSWPPVPPPTLVG